MKKTIITAILALSAASAFAQGATGTMEITRSHQGELMRLGSVSASVGTTDELSRKLAVKAEAAGADYFSVTHINTRNLGYATATIYNNAVTDS